jgi:acyl-CoA synthetase (AMP-forming)/AMP-acid ligase II
MMIAAYEVNTLAELPGHVAARLAGKTAIIAQDRRLTYRELEQLSNGIAHRLVERGLDRGDRVAVLARDSATSVALLFGSAKAQTVWTGLNWRLSIDELVDILDDAEPKLVFFDEAFAVNLEQALARSKAKPELVALSATSSLGVAFEPWLGAPPTTSPERTYRAEDVVVQLYTSGTTGLPKGVQLPNRSFFAVPQAMEQNGQPFLGWTSADTSLLFVPTFYVAALWWLVRGLAFGGTNVVQPIFQPAEVLRAIAEHRVTKLGLVPAMLQMILAEPAIEETDLSSLRSIFYGGSPIALPLLERARARLDADLYQAYGMTETGNAAVCLGPEEHREGRAERLMSAGRPLPGVQVRILARDGSAVKGGKVGEIAILSPASMRGYWNKPNVTAATLIDGWVMTGDLGYVDDDGYVYVVDRSKDMIISAGENIYPAEIEKVLKTQPNVGDAAVIGIPHELWGEEILAFVVPRTGTELTARDVALHARAHLANYKVPSRIELVKELPRNASGKVLKTKLREPYWQGRTRQVN